MAVEAAPYVNTDYLITAASIVMLVAGASERLVEVIKGFIPPLNGTKDDPAAEARRKAWIQLLTVACCLLSALLARSQIGEALWGPGQPINTWVIIGIGVLSAGGSSFWNSVLTYLVGVKDIKKSEATEQKRITTQKEHGLDSMLPKSLPKVGQQTGAF